MPSNTDTAHSQESSDLALQAHANLDALLASIVTLLGPERQPEPLTGPRTLASLEGRDCSYVILQVPRPKRVDRLTAREKQVAALASAGYSNRAIAQILSIRDATVSAHLKKVLQKLQLNSRLELALQRRFFESTD